MSDDRRRKRVPRAILETGERLEMIYRPEEGRTSFVVWQGDRVLERDEVETAQGTILTPYSPENSLIAHGVVVLPSGVSDYGTINQLRREVRDFVHRYVDLSPDFEAATAVYVLFSWIYDDFEELPYLRVRGDYGSGKSRFLLAVGSLCYMPIFASGASTTAPLFRILDLFRGTLILDEADFRFSDEKAEIIKILNNGNARGFPVLRAEVSPSKEINPVAFAVFGPKLVATRGAFVDRALESRSITEELGVRPLRSEISLNLPPAFYEEAAALRRKLLLFRLKTSGTERDLQALRMNGLSPRVSQLFAPLLSTVEDEAERQVLLGLAKKTNRDLVEERASDPAAELLAVLLDLSKEREDIPVGELAEAFAAKATLDRPATARYVGYLLRQRLSLKPHRRRGSFVLSQSELSKLPTIALRFGLTGDIEDVEDIETEVEEERRKQG